MTNLLFIMAALQLLNFFTRTGKRTRWGLLMDGWNSIIRYYKNNFSDGFRQVDMSTLHTHPCFLLVPFFLKELVMHADMRVLALFVSLSLSLLHTHTPPEV